MQLDLTLDWADGSYNFKLPWAACAEIERKGGAGIQVIYERVMIGQAHLADVTEIIRQGLLGGAGGTVDKQPVECKPQVVSALLDRYVTGPEAQPFTESWNLAKAILHAFMVGYEPAQADGSKKKAGRRGGRGDRIDLGQILANCAMMNIPPSEAKALTLHDYQALLHGWEQAHSTEETIEPPTVEETEERMRSLEARGVRVLH